MEAAVRGYASLAIRSRRTPWVRLTYRRKSVSRRRSN
jgi:hypothetical protein